ncbi:HlyD family type I secretion periplasmic adaptor subunit [Thauera sp. 2A1]|uniref:HlyD family type I secretion periplasmic adaptor subunit n=1 Tax=Thauera sp. 2A1 TaxID=2570191 RepID=UPI001291E7D4|nr:HlyD family type I secretion periplasmic adaptor subunit [Thauera sp. 2A1]KAI5913217.1 HlyD family type I secretion periplasmic adaptor subunit [Thauera sp. 2A1]
MAIRNIDPGRPVGADRQSPAQVVDAEPGLPTDTGRPARLGMWVLGLGFGGFLLWAGLAPLDEGVPTAGMVAIDTKRKAVQHLSGGIVSEVHVKEGQYVRNGDPLLRIDDAMAVANYESVRQHYLTLRAMEGRLLAEQADRASVAFHPDLQDAPADPLIRQAMDNQQSLFAARRSALKAELDAIRENIQGEEAAIRGYEGMLSARRTQLELLQDELKGLRELVQEGYAPRNKQLEIQRLAAEAAGSIADLQGNIQRARRSIAEMKLRAVQRTQEYRKEVDAQLAEIRREVQADAEKLKAAGNELARTTIRSPAEGQVVGLVSQTVGGVIAPGQKLMDVVPRDETLLLETRVPPHMIDRVQPGMETDVRFSSFAHSPALVVQGKVDSVSTDLITEPETKQSYYLARISLTPRGMKELGDRQLQAGMPAEVVIRTGERTVLTYLLHPLLKRMAASMKEE